jgi:hypothetical protein
MTQGTWRISNDMANALYDKGREGFLDGSINWLTDSVKVMLVNTTSYTVNLATHQYVSDIAGAAIVARSAALASKSATAGVANAANVTFSAVTAVMPEDSGPPLTPYEAADGSDYEDMTVEELAELHNQLDAERNAVNSKLLAVDAARAVKEFEAERAAVAANAAAAAEPQTASANGENLAGQ